MIYFRDYDMMKLNPNEILLSLKQRNFNPTNMCASTVIDKIPVITFSEFHGMIGKFYGLIFVEENSSTILVVLMYMLVQIICITK